MGTRGDYLDNFLKSLNLPYYEGIFAADTVPSSIIKKPTFCIIINTDLYGMEGSHWISVIKHHGKSKIFDSSLTPRKLLFPVMNRLFSKLNATRIRSNKIQSSNSYFCGFYCLHEILKFHLLIKQQLKKTDLTKFSKNTNKNDIICINNIKTMLKKKNINY